MNNPEGRQNRQPNRIALTVCLMFVGLWALCWRPVSVSSEPEIAGVKAYLPLVMGSAALPVGPVGGTFTSFAVDPGENDRIYAGHYGSGVYKSFDQGNTWYRKSQGLGNLTIQSLAAHPTNSSIVYAGTYNGGLYKSNNGGESWLPSNGGVLDNHIIYDIEIDRTNPQRIFVVSRVSGSLKGYLSRSLDGGSNWTVLLTGSSFSNLDYFYDVDIDPINPNIVFLTAHEHGFYRSTNGGVSFSAVNLGVTDLSARSFAVDNAFSGLIYGGVWHGAGVFRSWDDGTAWAWAGTGLPQGVKVYRLYLDPFGRGQKAVFVCTYGNGLYRSADFGATWSSRGLGGQRLYDFMIADGKPQRWYVATENNGIFRSTTYGSNWNTIMADLRLVSITGLTRIPNDPSALAGAVYGQGVFRVSDGGETWEAMNNGLDSLDVVSLAVAGEQLFAIGRNRLDVWEDGIWRAVDLPIASQEALNAGRDWVNGRVLLTEEALGAETGFGFQPTNVFELKSGLFVSLAGAGVWEVGAELQEQTWDGTRMLGETGQSFEAAVETGALNLTEELKGLEADGVTVASALTDRCVWAVAEGNQVWFTSDCGTNWRTLQFDGTVQALGFDPLASDVLIIGTREAGAFRVYVSE